MQKIIIFILFLSNCSEANSPHNIKPRDISPFNNQEQLLRECAIDLLCGEYSYETGLGETGDARVFKQKDTYYIHYIRDDGIEYIGIGVLSSNYLAITYIYPGFSDVGTTHYEIKNGNLYGYWTCLECDGQIISENLYKK